MHTRMTKAVCADRSRFKAWKSVAQYLLHCLLHRLAIHLLLSLVHTTMSSGSSSNSSNNQNNVPPVKYNRSSKKIRKLEEAASSTSTTATTNGHVVMPNGRPAPSPTTTNGYRHSSKHDEHDQQTDKHNAKAKAAAPSASKLTTTTPSVVSMNMCHFCFDVLYSHLYHKPSPKAVFTNNPL